MKKNTIILIIAFVALAIFFYYSFSPQKQSTGKALAQVQVPDLSFEAKQGEQLFNANCASCHGANAAGQENVAPSLIHKIYEPSHHGDAAFYRAVQAGVRQHHWSFGNMAPVKDLSKEEINLIIGYVRELQRANGIN